MAQQLYTIRNKIMERVALVRNLYALSIANNMRDNIYEMPQSSLDKLMHDIIVLLDGRMPYNSVLSVLLDHEDDGIDEVEANAKYGKEHNKDDADLLSYIKEQTTRAKADELIEFLLDLREDNDDYKAEIDAEISLLKLTSNAAIVRVIASQYELDD